MKATFKDTPESNVKWWAAQDARMRSIANKSKWDTKTQLKVEAMKAVLGYIYSGKIYESYNVKSVSVKIDQAIVKDKKLLRQAESNWDSEGIVKTVTPQGVLYRIA
ncbi:hypothetical protein UFOVP116_137 [uncultured Caudovirales phage]|uniref:Uncharacterized protein n=1 Tax=uncultured Caudovirales phage TaxID=2100421 RepID=A0A6J5L6V4_9CAUD|nr:hypothetical protein UFOVP116_137 [uncultured Caudovirales phage]